MKKRDERYDFDLGHLQRGNGRPGTIHNDDLPLHSS